jgi:hypothetical protein
LTGLGFTRYNLSRDGSGLPVVKIAIRSRDTSMYESRKKLYAQLEKERQSKVLVYVTGDRRQLETKISSEVLDFFTEHLDNTTAHLKKAYRCKKISLILYSRGGETLAAWSIVNLIRQFTEYLEVIVPSKAHSAGTLICLGANSIVMTKQATLGPIDPSVNTPLNPQIAGAPPNARFPVSVEDLNGYVEFCRATVKRQTDMKVFLAALSEKVHPLVLGNAYRARSQIRMLAKKLLTHQQLEPAKAESLLKFLCGESGSHDYTINRKEAREELGLPVEEPSEGLYKLISSIYNDIASELELTSPFDPNSLLGADNSKNYTFTRALIESIAGGSDVFLSEGILTKTKIPAGMPGLPGMPGMVQEGIQDARSFEGWRHKDG